MNNKVAEIFMRDMSGLQLKCCVCGIFKNTSCSYGAPLPTILKYLYLNGWVWLLVELSHHETTSSIPTSTSCLVLFLILHSLTQTLKTFMNQKLWCISMVNTTGTMAETMVDSTVGLGLVSWLASMGQIGHRFNTWPAGLTYYKLGKLYYCLSTCLPLQHNCLCN